MKCCSFYKPMPDTVTIINKDNTKVLNKTSDLLWVISVFLVNYDQTTIYRTNNFKAYLNYVDIF